MRFSAIGLAIALLAVSLPVLALEGREYQMREDMGTEALYDNGLSYYYHILCPDYPRFWGFCHEPWERGTAVGAWFEIGDLSTGAWPVCDPTQCHTLERVRVLDFYGCESYPGECRCRMDIYCCDEYGSPVGPSLYNRECFFVFAWNYFDVNPPLCVSSCCVDPGPPASRPRILVTMTHDGTVYGSPADNWNWWGADNVSSPLEEGCMMHESGCLPALYPRPYSSHYGTIHSGYYGYDFEYCPPRWFKDHRDSTPDGTEYGFVELAWCIYVTCTGPTEVQPTSWGSIKAMYK